jgi:hypothetical protein
MANCVVCGQQNPPGHAPVLVPACHNCGFNPMKSEESLGSVAKKIMQNGETKMAGEPVAISILGSIPITNQMGKDRAKRLIRLLVGVHGGADWCVNVMKDAPTPNRVKRIAALDNALRAQDPEGQEILGNLNHGTLAGNPDSVGGHCKQGWDTIKTKWPTLDDAEKRLFTKDVFEHDKGLPQTVQSALNFVPPAQVSMDGVLMRVLFNNSNTNPYTSQSSQSGDLGSKIQAGWPTANDDQKKTMWFNLMYKIGEAFNLDDGGTIAAKLQQHRQDVVGQLENYVPRQAAERFVDVDARAAWTFIMG